ncbi:hypothetical protein [Mycobacterium colombiense]|uniref:hypothetical protein n=1 Tax=Mycobacterium colombiense TaxID=339268 RepID=UPI00200A2846|nr:hypothetical protein [Mycobacterium colombiense]MCK8645633.1 hypothetical protein [Mycobacterium colombiense]
MPYKKPVGTVIWTLPDRHTYVTTPGSALLFPQLCTPTGDVITPPPPRPDRCTDRTAMMPRRTRTRAQHRAARIATERKHNREARRPKPRECEAAYFGPAPPPDGDEPPPF